MWDALHGREPEEPLRTTGSSWERPLGGSAALRSRRVRQDGRTASLHCVFVIHELCVFNDPPSCKTRTHSDIRGLTFLPCPLPAHVVQQRGVKVPLFEETGEWKTDGAKSGDGRHSWLRKQ